MTTQIHHPEFCLEPEEIRFSEPAEEFPRYTEIPDRMYRLLTDKAEIHIILQAKADRKIVTSRDASAWEVIPPRMSPEFESAFKNGMPSLDGGVFLGRSFHRSDEPGWETIASWGDWGEEPLLELAKVVIAEDQAKLFTDYQKEQQRIARRSEMHNAIAGNTVVAQ